MILSLILIRLIADGGRDERRMAVSAFSRPIMSKCSDFWVVLNFMFFKFRFWFFFLFFNVQFHYWFFLKINFWKKKKKNQPITHKKPVVPPLFFPCILNFFWKSPNLYCYIFSPPPHFSVLYQGQNRSVFFCNFHFSLLTSFNPFFFFFKSNPVVSETMCALFFFVNSMSEKSEFSARNAGNLEF